MTTKAEYLAAVITATEVHPEWRYGQAALVVLMALRPDLAKLVYDTDRDPFFARAANDPQLVRFMDFLDTNWPVKIPAAELPAIDSTRRIP